MNRSGTIFFKVHEILSAYRYRSVLTSLMRSIYFADECFAMTYPKQRAVAKL